MSTPAPSVQPAWLVDSESFLARFLPAIFGGLAAAEQLTEEDKAGVSKTQLASDSANAALGITEAIESDNPQVVAEAQVAAAAVQAVTASIASIQNISSHPAVVAAATLPPATATSTTTTVS